MEWIGKKPACIRKRMHAGQVDIDTLHACQMTFLASYFISQKGVVWFNSVWFDIHGSFFPSVPCGAFQILRPEAASTRLRVADSVWFDALLFFFPQQWMALANRKQPYACTSIPHKNKLPPIQWYDARCVSQFVDPVICAC